MQKNMNNTPQYPVFIWSEKDKEKAAKLIFESANSYEVKPLKCTITAVEFRKNGTAYLSAIAHNHTLEYAIFDGKNWVIQY